ncbi:MAG TPA: autotransporter-associated beta strand repeat-containing protein [Chthoniobacterales bacterium]
MTKQPNNPELNMSASVNGSTLLPATLAALLLFGLQATAHAGSATWDHNPKNGDWNTARNWTLQTVPNGPDDVAIFESSATTEVALSAAVELNEIEFRPEAPSFIVSLSPNAPLTLSGKGITNLSTATEGLYAGGLSGGPGAITFRNRATVRGPVTMGTRSGGTSSRGVITFSDTSNASISSSADVEYINDAGGRDSLAGEIVFTGSSTAGKVFIENSGGLFARDSAKAFIIFMQSSNAGQSIIGDEGGEARHAPGGETDFMDSSSAADVEIFTGAPYNGGLGGSIKFFGDSTGGQCMLGLGAKGTLDISAHNPPGLTIGALVSANASKSAVVFLGGNNLVIGQTQYPFAEFNGAIEDGGVAGGVGGSITKIGPGSLTFTGANRFTGGTVVSAGAFTVANAGGSATGTGPVSITRGYLAGSGIIAGPVTIGTGNGSGAFLEPAYDYPRPRTLTIQNTLTFAADGTYIYSVEAPKNAVHADQVIAAGVTIEAGARFSFVGDKRQAVAVGTVFTVIDNTSASPIAGTFANLPDGSTFDAGPNTYLANYEGGDRNDLTLTVQ